ncbi:MAG: hypothetical protein GY888_00855, partial [Planctomycetaceae bacterium]|nr:hypothetical protein [Planctomycetaceae bacterium]
MRTASSIKTFLASIGILAFSSPSLAATCPGDVDGNEQVNITDLLAVIGGWG